MPGAVGTPVYHFALLPSEDAICIAQIDGDPGFFVREDFEAEAPSLPPEADFDAPADAVEGQPEADAPTDMDAPADPDVPVDAPTSQPVDAPADDACCFIGVIDAAEGGAILVRPEDGSGFCYECVLFPLDEPFAEWAGRIGARVEIVCADAFQESLPPIGRLLAIRAAD